MKFTMKLGVGNMKTFLPYHRTTYYSLDPLLDFTYIDAINGVISFKENYIQFKILHFSASKLSKSTIF